MTGLAMEARQTAGKVLCYGILGIDQIVQVESYPERDGHTRILTDGEYVGGEAANTAVTLSGLKVGVKLMGNTLGEDRRGSLFLSAIRPYRLDPCDLDVEQGVRTLHTVVVSDRGGARSIMGYFPDLRSRPLQPGDLEGISLLSVDPFLGKNAVDAARMAREAGIGVFAIEISEAHPLAGLSDVVINSRGFMRRHKSDTASDVALGLLKAGVKTVVITRGGEGCTVYQENGSSFDQPAFSVPVRDTTGAGDGFRAGLIYGYLQGWTLTRSIQFASGCAALTCCASGGGGHIGGEEQVLRFIGSA